MAMGHRRMNGVGALVGFGLMLGLVGCDYWPPALQAQIEQLRSEAQTVAMEKAHLQSQVTELSKAKQDLQTQVDELTRVNREKSSMINGLQNQVDALRVKVAKAMTPKAPVKRAARGTPKATSKKKTSVKR